jgi:hypothetical protein
VDYKTIHEKVKKLGLERTKDDNGGRDKSESKAKKPGKRAMDGEEPWEDRLPLEQESEAVLG